MKKTALALSIVSLFAAGAASAAITDKVSLVDASKVQKNKNGDYVVNSALTEAKEAADKAVASFTSPTSGVSVTVTSEEEVNGELKLVDTPYNWDDIEGGTINFGTEIEELKDAQDAKVSSDKAVKKSLKDLQSANKALAQAEEKSAKIKADQQAAIDVKKTAEADFEAADAAFFADPTNAENAAAREKARLALNDAQADLDAIVSSPEFQYFVNEEHETGASKAINEATAEVEALVTVLEQKVLDQKATDEAYAEALAEAKLSPQYEGYVAVNEAVADKKALDKVATDATKAQTEGEFAATLSTDFATLSKSSAAVITPVEYDFSDPDDLADQAENAVNALGQSIASVSQATQANAKAVSTLAGEVQVNRDQINVNSADIATNKAGIETNAAGIATNKVDIATNKAGIETNAAGIATNKVDIATNKTGIETNAQAIVSNTSGINKNAADIVDLRQDFEALSADYYSFKEQTNGAIAGVAAMGQLAQPYGVGNINVGVGVGSYAGEQAIAVGLGYRYSDVTTLRAAVAANSGDDMEPVVAASVNWEW